METSDFPKETAKKGKPKFLVQHLRYSVSISILDSILISKGNVGDNNGWLTASRTNQVS